MTVLDYILIAVIAAAVVFAVRHTVRARKRGGCSGCSGCSGDCASCPSARDGRRQVRTKK